VRASTAYA